MAILTGDQSATTTVDKGTGPVTVTQGGLTGSTTDTT